MLIERFERKFTVGGFVLEQYDPTLAFSINTSTNTVQHNTRAIGVGKASLNLVKPKNCLVECSSATRIRLDSFNVHASHKAPEFVSTRPFLALVLRRRQGQTRVLAPALYTRTDSLNFPTRPNTRLRLLFGLAGKFNSSALVQRRSQASYVYSWLRTTNRRFDDRTGSFICWSDRVDWNIDVDDRFCIRHDCF